MRKKRTLFSFEVRVLCDIYRMSLCDDYRNLASQLFTRMATISPELHGKRDKEKIFKLCLLRVDSIQQKL